MSVQTYPPTSGTVHVIHSGTAAGEAFTSLFTGADGAPTLPDSTFTWDLTGTDLEGLYPSVTIFRTTGEMVTMDVSVSATSVTVSSVVNVDPAFFRIKVVA
jgi:hypothetical protein